jgi:hypothetical protein
LRSGSTKSIPAPIGAIEAAGCDQFNVMPLDVKLLA